MRSQKKCTSESAKFCNLTAKNATWRNLKTYLVQNLGCAIANTCNTLFSSTFKNAWKQVTLNEYTIYNKMKVVKNKKVKVKTQPDHQPLCGFLQTLIHSTCLAVNFSKQDIWLILIPVPPGWSYYIQCLHCSRHQHQLNTKWPLQFLEESAICWKQHKLTGQKRLTQWGSNKSTEIIMECRHWHMFLPRNSS